MLQHKSYWSKAGLTGTCLVQAMLKYDIGSKQVQLVSDRHYRAGQELLVWCGPQASLPACTATCGC